MDAFFAEFGLSAARRSNPDRFGIILSSTYEGIPTTIRATEMDFTLFEISFVSPNNPGCLITMVVNNGTMRPSNGGLSSDLNAPIEITISHTTDVGQCTGLFDPGQMPL